ncbi:hypothetical protein E2562_022772 [Oryza meyeriana var. granulata]|uniref:Uncharacterized protein n=1 Tax=Oryza meyeriana var. granulata TaxID=110450 RepID=A0A6G1FB16_9ORYZ|nr:hypothetical protein E2562_022772 [Oryza meyeriana var. granulata]
MGQVAGGGGKRQRHPISFATSQFDLSMSNLTATSESQAALALSSAPGSTPNSIEEQEPTAMDSEGSFMCQPRIPNL